MPASHRALVVADADILGHVPGDPAQRQLPLVGFQRAGQNAKQSALAHAVGADEADVLSWRDPKRDIREQHLASRMGVGETRDDDMAHGDMLAGTETAARPPTLESCPLDM